MKYMLLVRASEAKGLGDAESGVPSGRDLPSSASGVGTAVTDTAVSDTAVSDTAVRETADIGTVVNGASGETAHDALAAFDDRLIRAGVLLAAETLEEDSTAARVSFSGEQATVAYGPFAGTSDSVSRFWILQVASRDEAIWWAKSVPLGSGVVEVRRVLRPDVDPHQAPVDDEFGAAGHASGRRTA